jgi:hypothetical protein
MTTFNINKKINSDSLCAFLNDSNFGSYLGPIYSVELEIKLKDIMHTAKHDSYFKLHIEIDSESR